MKFIPKIDADGIEVKPGLRVIDTTSGEEFIVAEIDRELRLISLASGYQVGPTATSSEIACRFNSFGDSLNQRFSLSGVDKHEFMRLLRETFQGGPGTTIRVIRLVRLVFKGITLREAKKLADSIS